MRVILQVVSSSGVFLEGKQIAHIDKGYALLVGFCVDDNKAIAEKMAEKIAKLRVFPDENGKTNLSLAQVGGRILSVSQFTLYGSVKDGNRPSFVQAMRQEEANGLYLYFLEKLKERVEGVESNIFHTDCLVRIDNSGPFTLILDSKELFK